MKQEQLTPKQQLFVDNYLSNGGNASQAFIQAGYSASTENVVNASASKLLRSTKVASIIAKTKANNLAKQAKKREKIDIDQDWLISQLITTIEDSRADKAHNVTRNAIMDVGKVLGLIINRSEVNAQLSIDAQLTQLDTTTLIQALTEAKHPKAIEAEFHEVADE
tara:strand:+ start:173 stop:667 length:495 start_codon:yes stop_codon:yes gene_type:complete